MRRHPEGLRQHVDSLRGHRLGIHLGLDQNLWIPGKGLRREAGE
jgi:hypothetical protein